MILASPCKRESCNQPSRSEHDGHCSADCRHIARVVRTADNPLTRAPNTPRVPTPFPWLSGPEPQEANSAHR